MAALSLQVTAKDFRGPHSVDRDAVAGRDWRARRKRR